MALQALVCRYDGPVEVVDDLVYKDQDLEVKPQVQPEPVKELLGQCGPEENVVPKRMASKYTCCCILDSLEFAQKPERMHTTRQPGIYSNATWITRSRVN